MASELYLVAYDVRDKNRLRRVHRFISRYFHSAQKSVFECYLTNQLRDIILDGMSVHLDLEEDFFCIARIEELDPSMQLRQQLCLFDRSFTYLG